MSDLVLFLMVWLIATGLGLPLALLLPRDRPGRLLAAPVLGFGAAAIAASLLYRAGVSTGTAAAVLAAAAALGGGLSLRRAWAEGRGGMAVWIGTAAAVALLLLLPAWLGGPQFTVFQGNIWDQMSYLARSLAYHDLGYAEVMAADRTMPLANNFILFAKAELAMRPGISIVHAAAAHGGAGSLLGGAYAFTAVLQFLMLYAAGFTISTIFGRTGLVGALMAAALTLGFFGQYVLDINAWSQLAGMPMVLVATALGLRVLATAEPPPRPLVASTLFGLAVAATIYLYPEITPIYLLPIAAVTVLSAVVAQPGARRLAGTAGRLVLAAVVAATLLAPVWDGTVGFLWRQVTAAMGQSVDWYAYFQRYLMPGDLFPALRAYYLTGQFPVENLWQMALFAPVDLVTGLFGLYFLAPAETWPLELRVAWRVGLYGVWIAMAVAVLATFRTSVRRDADPPRRAFLLFAACGLLMPLPLVAAGKLWMAGKAIAMIGPLLFLLAALPLLADRVPPWRRVLAGLFVLAHLGFGLARPIAAGTAEDGIHYRFPPYPAIQEAAWKQTLSWDLAADAPNRLAGCTGIAVDIANPFLDRYLQMALTEHKLPWWSVRPINTYFDRGAVLGLQTPLGEADCRVTDGPAPQEAGGSRVLSLARPPS